MKHLIFLIAVFILHLAHAEPKMPIHVYNGLKKTTVRSEAIVPYTKEILGSERRFDWKVLENPNVTFLENIVNEQSNGLFIAFSEGQVICIGNKKNNLFDGEYCIYPDDELSARAIVKMGVLEGKCDMVFQPFKYSAYSKMVNVNPFSDKARKLGINEDEWIKNGDGNLKISTEGFFKEGKRFSGDFLNVVLDGTAHFVTIETYENFELISKTQPKVFIIQPYVLR